MHKRYISFTLFLTFTVMVSAQYKEQLNPPEMRSALSAPTQLMLGFLNPDKFSMNHSFSSSFSSGGGGSLMQNTYINTMNYQFNDKLNLRVNLGLMNTPHNTYYKNLPGVSWQDQTRFFGGGELNYRPSEKTSVSLSIYSLPGGFYRPYNYYPYDYRNRND